MKPRFFALPALALLAFTGLTGCGGGNHSSPTGTPIIDPAPSVYQSSTPTTSDTGVTTYANYNNAGIVGITVKFSTSAASNAQYLIEYHLYRNNVIAARLTGAEVQSLGDTVAYNDPGITAPVAYQHVKGGGQTGPELETVQSAGVGAFLANTPVVYRITQLYANGDGTYTELETGRSNAITPYQ